MKMNENIKDIGPDELDAYLNEQTKKAKTKYGMQKVAFYKHSTLDVILTNAVYKYLGEPQRLSFRIATETPSYLMVRISVPIEGEETSHPIRPTNNPTWPWQVSMSSAFQMTKVAKHFGRTFAFALEFTGVDKEKSIVLVVAKSDMKPVLQRAYAPSSKRETEATKIVEAKDSLTKVQVEQAMRTLATHGVPATDNSVSLLRRLINKLVVDMEDIVLEVDENGMLRVTKVVHKQL